MIKMILTGIEIFPLNNQKIENKEKINENK